MFLKKQKNKKEELKSAAPEEKKEKKELTPEEKKEKKKRKRRKRIRQLITKFVVVGFLLFVVFHFLITVVVVHDNDMFPFIADGQGVIVYKRGKIMVQEVVLYEAKGRQKIGRIVAQGGDSVEITEDGFFINGNINYSAIPYDTKPPTDKAIRVKVPQGQYYILNDFRERFTDSRTFGCIKAEDIKGLVVFTVKYRGF